MSKSITATELRADVYQILDHVLETGEPQTITRKGRRLVLVPAEGRVRFGDGPRLDVTDDTVDELAAVSWRDAWSGQL